MPRFLRQLQMTLAQYTYLIHHEQKTPAPLHLFNSPRTTDMHAPIIQAAPCQDDASQVAIELYVLLLS